MGTKKKKQKASILPLFLALLFIGTGAFYLLYPYFQGKQQSQVIYSSVQEWDQQQVGIPKDPTESIPAEEDEFVPPVLTELYLTMKRYNKILYETEQEKFSTVADYQNAVLDLTHYDLEPDLIGKVTIPKIDLEMALYMGATDTNLAKGLAHMGQTSLPIGGVNTNCVISGHRGWRGSPYLRDINLIEVGDSVFVENFWQTLEYRVVSWTVITPTQREPLLIQPGKDMLTIFTCEPYGVGTHRYVLYCERYHNTEASQEESIPPIFYS